MLFYLKRTMVFGTDGAAEVVDVGSYKDTK